MRKILFSAIITFSTFALLFSFGGFNCFVGKAQAKSEQLTFTLNKDVESVIEINSPTACLMDYASGDILFEKDSKKRVQIASMTKIMLLNLIFDEVDNGNLSLDEEIIVSENAKNMGGSQVFLRANENYKCSELVKSVIVASANDASVALAERLYGSESACVDKMNEMRDALKLENTLFSNVTGLTRPTQYSSAKDVALMLRKLISHQKYFEFSQIKLDYLTHKDGKQTMLSNTNKLLKTYSGCDGGKTGFTAEAKYCLASTVKRGEMRLISVTCGASSSNERFLDNSKIFDYGFNCYSARQIVDAKTKCDIPVRVKRGKKSCVFGNPKESFTATVKKGASANYRVEYLTYNNLKAPISVGDKLGEAVIYKDNIEVKRIDIVSTESILKKSLLDAIKEII